jgi:hypothetical protein
VRSFRSNADLRRYVSQADPGRRVRRLDFERRPRVVLVTVGPRSSSGYSIDVKRVVEERTRIVVDVVERTPKLGDAVHPQVTSPYRLLALSDAEKPAAVRWENR